MQIHNKFSDIIREDKTIGLPMTPSHWVGKPQYVPLTIIKMAHGSIGGFEGAYEYVKRFKADNIAPDGFINVTTIDGIEKRINAAYIVSATNSYQLITARINSKNPNYPIGEHEYRYLAFDEVKVILEDRY